MKDRSGILPIHPESEPSGAKLLSERFQLIQIIHRLGFLGKLHLRYLSELFVQLVSCSGEVCVAPYLMYDEQLHI